MSYLLTGYLREIQGIHIIYKLEGNDIYSCLGGSWGYRSNTWERTGFKDRSDLLKTIIKEWRCDVVHEVDNLKDIDKYLLALELTR